MCPTAWPASFPALSTRREPRWAPPSRSATHHPGSPPPLNPTDPRASAAFRRPTDHLGFGSGPGGRKPSGDEDQQADAGLGPAAKTVVNVGRGPIVDYTALVRVLGNGHLAGGGIDVAWDAPIDPGDELLGENVTVTTHIGGVTSESYAAMAQTFAANAHRLQTGEPIAHRVAHHVR